MQFYQLLTNLLHLHQFLLLLDTFTHYTALLLPLAITSMLKLILEFISSDRLQAMLELIVKSIMKLPILVTPPLPMDSPYPQFQQ
jgi:hypothetical protein